MHNIIPVKQVCNIGAGLEPAMFCVEALKLEQIKTQRDPRAGGCGWLACHYCCWQPGLLSYIITRVMMV